jgi:pyruvate formate lyase activating enzyme
LIQPEFCAALLAACRNEGLHTALETCGYQSWEIIKPILELVDLVLYDIKLMDPRLHAEFTGKPNDLILANAAWIASVKKPLIIRIPVIPNHNDSVANIQATAAWAKKIGALELHLLPYHRLGEAKYIRLGRTYPLKDLQSPSARAMENLALVAAQADVPVQIGG